MGTISLSLPSDGQTIDAADVNTPLNTISAVINGNLDDDNVKVGANINGTKLLINSIPPTAGDANMRGGWNAGIVTAMPTVTALGNRSYSLVHATTDLTGYLSPGMRLKLTRTATAPTQCTSLNGTTQYYSKATPNKSTFTNNFVVFAAVKPSSYALGTIVSVYNGTSGWALRQLVTGQIELAGYNAGAANFFKFTSYQSVSLIKWTNNVIAQIDMSVTTNTPTTNYIMIDGVDVPGVATRGGTSPTTLVQAGNLNIGAENGGTNPYAGKIAQAGWFTAKVTQATMLSYLSQSLIGTETNLGSAYSFNGVITDLNTSNANDLTANGSAVATTLDTPFTQTMTGVTTGTTNYGIITAASFSTNTTLTVQVAEGDTIPTSGGVSAISYSTQKTPYGFPAQKNKWILETHIKNQISYGVGTAGIWYYTGFNIYLPVGEWDTAHYATTATTHAGATFLGSYITLSTSNNSEIDDRFRITTSNSNASLTSAEVNTSKQANISQTAAGAWYFIMSPINSSTTQLVQGSSGNSRITACNAYL